MKAFCIKYSVLLFCFHASVLLYGQTAFIPDTVQIPATYKPEFRRQINHDAINREVKAIYASDKTAGTIFAPVANDEINFLLTRLLAEKVPMMQYRIETSRELDHRLKVNYLKGLENVLRYYRQNWTSKQQDKKVNPIELPQILLAYESCMKKDLNNESIEPEIQKLSLGAGQAILHAGIFDKNAGYKSSKDLLILKYCMLYPEETFLTLRNNPDVPFADSLVRAMAQKYPHQLYDYAAAGNKLGEIIRRITDDPFIYSITRMARSKSGRLYFPFLDNIVKGKIDFDEIDRVKDDSIAYYKLLVKTRLDYAERAIEKDTAYGYADVSEMIRKKAEEVFVNVINGLHDIDNPNIRFRIIQHLNAQELYYVAISTDGIIYTSSFVKGVYPMMMSKVNQRGDSLLQLVMFDKYRKFIKMTAAYNTLGHFLKSFPNQADAANLMRAFVGGLEKTGSLEDGVDVADSYASIAENNKPLAEEMIGNVQLNYKRTEALNHRRGMVMYDLLYKLFLSADTANRIDLSKEFGIPPVYHVDFSSLANDSGKVIMQVFFYGDKDGQNIFQGFLRMFSSANWKTAMNEKWVTISSTAGKPVFIYANRPLPEETGEDEMAQKALDEYLQKTGQMPTVVIHRGHSYYVNTTISHIQPSARIVFMGSCGGYHLIHDILKAAPDAHIIASKQIGKTAINRPFFQLLMEKVRSGSNIDWIPFWQELNKMVYVEGFEDYIPPYKNLGALFIKAYRKAMGDEGF
jgi:hypothetical protein